MSVPSWHAFKLACAALSSPSLTRLACANSGLLSQLRIAIDDLPVFSLDLTDAERNLQKFGKTQTDLAEKTAVLSSLQDKLARLEATRELRRDDGTPCEAGFANFSTTSETQAGASPLHSAPAGDGENVSKNRQSVNQDLSSDGKDPWMRCRHS